MALSLTPGRPTMRELAEQAIAAASRDPIARRRRERAGLDIPEVPAELTDETRATLLGVSSAAVTFPQVPKWWQVFKRLGAVALLVGLAACDDSRNHSDSIDWPTERLLAARTLDSAGMTNVALGESQHLGPCGPDFCRATRFSARNSAGASIRGVVCRRTNGPAFIAFD